MASCTTAIRLEFQSLQAGRPRGGLSMSPMENKALAVTGPSRPGLARIVHFTQRKPDCDGVHIMDRSVGRAKGKAARLAAELHRYDKELIGENWRPAIGVLAVLSAETEPERLPRLPADSENLEAGFVVQLRTFASRI